MVLDTGSLGDAKYTQVRVNQATVQFPMRHSRVSLAQWDGIDARSKSTVHIGVVTCAKVSSLHIACSASEFTSVIPETCVIGGFGNFVICMPALQLHSIKELRLCLQRRRRQSATFGMKSTRTPHALSVGWGVQFPLCSRPSSIGYSWRYLMMGGQRPKYSLSSPNSLKRYWFAEPRVRASHDGNLDS